MNTRCMPGILVLLCLIFLGCNGVRSPSKANWISRPECIEVDNPLFTAGIAPQKKEASYYASFLLTITNKSALDLNIDWNASRYLFNRRPQGALVFEGIDPRSVKTGTVPPETVAAGTVFTREVMPLRLIAWKPLREKTPGRPGIRPGMIPQGQNGIHLVVHHPEGPTVVPLSVLITKDVSP